jgi:lipoprotein-anchoring transpeptidase ErfK/SrfK
VAVTTDGRAARVSLAAGLVLLAVAWTGQALPAPARAVEPTQELALLLRGQAALAKPDPRAKPVRFVHARRPITYRPTVLPVIGHGTGPGGSAWLRVRLPGRPNGSTGWIRRYLTADTTTSWHIVVATSRRRVTVYRQGRVVRVFAAIVGKTSTPTPQGEFFVEESVRLGAADVGAPFALALSARSNVLQEFAGGPGQIALHGLGNIGGRLGTAVSHGCVRLDNDAMRWLAVRIGPGTPVTITG